jgi:diguanylate cyclase (GGDEF)-like protein/PAS domain S-box-containing protein
MALGPDRAQVAPQCADKLTSQPGDAGPGSPGMSLDATLTQFIPHGYCLSWNPRLLALHIGSDAIIALSYASIPVMLLKLVRERHDLQFSWAFVLFGAFILACGATHALSVWTVWYPDYVLAGVLKALTALVSVGTAVVLWPLIPKAVALPGPAQWEAVHADLRQANDQLQAELAERVRRQADLQLAESVFRNTVNGIVVTDERSRIVSVNPAFTVLTGYAASEAVGQSLALLRDDSLPPGTHRTQWAELLAQGHWSGELWNRRKDGSPFCEWLNISRVPMVEGQPQRFVGIMVDVTERRRRDEHLRHQALHDPLTGLANRTQLIARLEEALGHAQREQGVVGLLFIDLDRFKPINDELGHDAGDAVLRELAARLHAQIRQCDLAARFGGDEFVLLLDQLDDIAAAEGVASRVLASLTQPVIVGTHALRVGASIGIAGGAGNALDAAGLMKQADEAMYVAKVEGGQRWHRAGAARLGIDDPAASI